METIELMQRHELERLDPRSGDEDASEEFTGQKGSEYEFWLFFFQLVSPSHIPEFEKRVQDGIHYKKGKISWDFWTGSEKSGYIAALKKIIKVVADPGGWRVDKDDWNKVKELANNVVTLRSGQLKARSPSYANHLACLKVWVKLAQTLAESKPKSSATIVKLDSRTAGANARITEYVFWLHYFFLVSPSHVQEFKEKLKDVLTDRTRDEILFWTFWTQFGGYPPALEEVKNTVVKNRGRWKEEDWDILKEGAQKVVTWRKNQLNPESVLWPFHLVALELWEGLVKILESTPREFRNLEIVKPRKLMAAEWDLWSFFLGVHSPAKQADFLRLVKTNNPTVHDDWSFWTEDEQKQSHATALDKLLETVNEERNDSRWISQDWEKLQERAESVLTQRKSRYTFITKGPLMFSTVGVEERKICYKWQEISSAVKRPLKLKLQSEEKSKPQVKAIVEGGSWTMYDFAMFSVLLQILLFSLGVIFAYIE